MKYTLVFELRRHFALQVLLIKCNIMLESQYIYLIVHWLNYNKHASSVASYYFYEEEKSFNFNIKTNRPGKSITREIGY